MEDKGLLGRAERALGVMRHSKFVMHYSNGATYVLSKLLYSLIRIRGKKNSSKIQKAMTCTCENLARQLLLQAGDVLRHRFHFSQILCDQPLSLELAFNLSFCTHNW